MWIADNWKDYELLDCGGGERLERVGPPSAGPPGPSGHLGDAQGAPGLEEGGRAVSPLLHRGRALGEKGPAGELEDPVTDLTFQVKPMNFKHTGLFPEQAVNWDFMAEKSKTPGGPSGC